MAKERLRRKDLRSPDEFVTLAAEASAWLRARRTQATWIAAGLAAFLVVLAVVSAFRGARARDANSDLGRALSALRGRDFSRAAQDLSTAATRWQPSLQGQIAAALVASAELRQGQADASIAAAQRAKSETPDLPPYLHQQLEYVWATALEDKNQTKEAAERYAAAANLEGPYRGPSLLGEARAREQLGEIDRAQELYRRYLEEFPEMPGRELVEPKVKKTEAS